MSAGPPIPSSAVYRFGPFRFDVALRRLYKYDEPIALTPKAADTLLALLERADRLVEKDELLSVVWHDVIVGEDTLAQNISTLRRALGDDVNQPQFIATMPRRGYRFVAPVMTTACQNEANRREVRSPATPERLTLRAAAQVSAVAIAVAIIALAMPHLRLTEDVPQPETEFSVSEPDDRRFSASGGMLAVSPNGEHLTFVATDASGTDSLWLRPLGAAAYRWLEGTDGASQPFWSPDSRTIGFFADRQLKAIEIASGAVRVIAPLTNARALGATWNRHEQILFSVPDDGLYIVPSSGGVPSRVTPAADHACSGCSAWPFFLPDGRHFLYTLIGAQGPSGIYLGELGRTDGRLLIDALSSSAYLASGFLMFARDGTLFQQRFDAGRQQITGPPRPIVDGVAFNPRTGRIIASMSDSGVLAFRRPWTTDLLWVDRTGAAQAVAAPPAIYMDFSIAPDGRRVAAARVDARTGTSDVWVFGEGVETRVTNAPDWDADPVWTADGTHVVYSSRRGNRWAIYRCSTSPLGPEEVLFDSDTPVTPLQALASSDMLFSSRQPNQRFDLWRFGEGRSTGVLHTGGFYPSDARVSPDAKVLAYGRPESGFGLTSQTVYLSSPSGDSDRRTVADGASSPRWRADGRELFYVAKDFSVVAVPIDSAYAPDIAGRRVLFRTDGFSRTGLIGQVYDAAPDGRRFLVKREVGSSPILVRVNRTMP